MHFCGKIKNGRIESRVVDRFDETQDHNQDLLFHETENETNDNADYMKICLYIYTIHNSQHMTREIRRNVKRDIKYWTIQSKD